MQDHHPKVGEPWIEAVDAVVVCRFRAEDDGHTDDFADRVLEDEDPADSWPVECALGLLCGSYGFEEVIVEGP